VLEVVRGEGALNQKGEGGKKKISGRDRRWGNKVCPRGEQKYWICTGARGGEYQVKITSELQVLQEDYRPSRGRKPTLPLRCETTEKSEISIDGKKKKKYKWGEEMWEEGLPVKLSNLEEKMKCYDFTMGHEKKKSLPRGKGGKMSMGGKKNGKDQN